MTKSNLSLKEIMDTLNQSGINPNATGPEMSIGKLGSEDAVRNNLYGKAQPVIDQGKAAYVAQLDKIAEMDKKLAGVYGDPTSPLYINRASTRDRIIGGATDTGYKAASSQADFVKQKKQELEDSIAQTMKVYDELTTSTKQNEAQIEKEKKASEKAAKAVETTKKKKEQEKKKAKKTAKKSDKSTALDKLINDAIKRQASK